MLYSSLSRTSENFPYLAPTSFTEGVVKAAAAAERTYLNHIPIKQDTFETGHEALADVGPNVGESQTWTPVDNSAVASA